MKTKVGITSFAHMHAHDYAAALDTLGETVNFVGVTDEDASRGGAAAREYGVRFFEEAGQLYAETDVAIVCSENDRHAGMVREALESGVHVLCEKPIATTPEDALAMIEAARKSGLRLGTAFPLRHAPVVRQARTAIDSGAVGHVVAVSGTNHGKIPGGWFVDPEVSGGGAVMDHTVHLADLLRWMLGTEVESVYAEVGSFFGDGGIDDGAILTLELENGAFATIDPSWSRGEGYPTWGDFTMRIVGTGGTVSLDVFGPSLTVFDHETSTTGFLNVDEDMNREMLADFVAGVRRGTAAGASGEDGLQALRVALAAYQSARDRRPRPVDRG